MDTSLRPTGIPAVGNIPWGTHICNFFQTPEDLVDTLVPYFKAGLDKDGKGEGRLSIATKIARSKDGKSIELASYSAEPVQLQDVHKQKN